jgi:trans-2,3-dihydro-3-hydroxyanthranilate isomerase
MRDVNKAEFKIMKSRHYFTLDVFTDRALAGNPLAVVLGSEGLDTARMQAIAGEFNLSETVFVFPPKNPANRAALRIFTPGKELPFAGHPTVGTAVLLSSLDKAGANASFVLEEAIGPVPCTATQSGAQFDVPKLPVQIEGCTSPADLAVRLGISVEDIGFDDHFPAIFSAGVPFEMVPVRSLDVIGRVRQSAEYVALAAAAPSTYVYTRETVDKRHQYHARMYAPAMGIVEDPATGAAAAAFAGVIAAFEELEDGVHAFVIEQGYEMGRPSQIELTLHVAGGAMIRASIGGGAVIISEGQLHL